MSALRYAVEEAIASLWRGRRFALLATATIATAVFVLGCFLVATANLERLAASWQGAAELSVFLADDASDADRRQVEALLAPGQVVSSFAFVSKAEALVRFKEMFGDLAPAVDALGGNPLPASYEVRLGSSDAARAGVEALVARLRQAAGVSDVRHDREWLDRLVTAITIVRRVGLLLGALLAIGAALTVTTVVRLALHARRDELEVMELVGSPPAFVLGPFIMEGALVGAVGGAAAVGALVAAYRALRPGYLVPWAAALSLPDVAFLSWATCLGLVLGATTVGCVSGWAAARSRG
jgi:cell division transport system permease protein